MRAYDQVQLDYRQKCKERIQRQLEISENYFACFQYY
jgi:hypothetical protein